MKVFWKDIGITSKGETIHVRQEEMLSSELHKRQPVQLGECDCDSRPAEAECHQSH
jgi:hypothetical protein